MEHDPERQRIINCLRDKDLKELVAACADDPLLLSYEVEADPTTHYYTQLLREKVVEYGISEAKFNKVLVELGTRATGILNKGS